MSQASRAQHFARSARRGEEKKCRSPHKAPVMQATVIRLQKLDKAFAGESFMENELN